jgi:hypothetical protein
LIQAQKEGKVRYIGFTGHKDTHIHLHMLEVAETSSVFDATTQNAAFQGDEPARLQEAVQA